MIIRIIHRLVKVNLSVRVSVSVLVKVMDHGEVTLCVIDRVS